MRLVVDTNVLLSAISARSPFHRIFLAIIEEGIHNLVISNEILTEYHEVLSRTVRPATLDILLEFLVKSPDIFRISPHYRFELISADPDDNKFPDCAICGNADFLITSDRHFDILKTTAHLKVNIISPVEFREKYL